MPGFLITIIVALFIVGVVLWGLEHFPWIDGDIKAAARVIIIVAVAIWLLMALVGYAPMLPSYPYRR